MKNFNKFNFSVFIAFNLFFTLAAQAADTTWISQVGLRKLSIANKEFKANDYGAVGDSSTLNTQAIQKAIDVCAAQGGGRVVFEPGQYVTGSIYIKTGVELFLGEAVSLLGSQDIADYPEIPTRVAGVEMSWPSALINIIKQKNSSVAGKGIIDGRGKPFWDSYRDLTREYNPKKLRWIVDYDAKRPRAFLIQDSWDIQVKDVTFRRSGFWTVHVLYSSYVTIDGVVVQNNIGGHGPSTDGIDIDSSSWIWVKNADIDCNDDNFCIKAGRDWDGLRVNRPTEYVLIENCISRRGGGLITFGSETSGGMRHIIARNLRAHGTQVGIRFKSARNRGGVLEDLYINNITMDSVGVAIEISPNWNPSYSYSTLPKPYKIEEVPEHWVKMLEPILPEGRGIPTFRDIYISDIDVKSARRAIAADGLEERPLSGFNFKNMTINSNEPGVIKNAKDWKFENVKINAKSGKSMQITNSTNVSL